MASITITFSAAAATRISTALQESQGLPDPATADEIKEYLTTDLKQMVRSSERRVAVKAANPTPNDVIIT